MRHCQRTKPPFTTDEKVMIEAFLDWHRATALCKLDGLTDEELRRPHAPSGLTPLGIVKHLGAVELSWFRIDFAGEDPESIPDLGEFEDYWRIEPDETTADVVAFYQDEVNRSRAITAAAALDDLARNPQPEDTGLTLRWILLHMIQETARHNGHLDLIREAIDGRTGQ
jgi:hypothetical protein